MTFYERLMEISGSKTTVDLEQWSGLHYNTLTNYKNDGNRVPKAEVLLKLYQDKGLSIDWLLSGVGSPYAAKEETPSNKPPKQLKSKPAEADAPHQPQVEQALLSSPAAGNTLVFGNGRFQIEIVIPEIIVKLTQITSEAQSESPEAEVHLLPKLKSGS